MQNIGTVYIASMNMRGQWAPAPPNATIINVTSAQSKSSKNRRDFSPMTRVEGRYKGFWNFESYWQSGKVYAGISHNITKLWWQNCNVPKRRYPGSKNKRVLHAIFDDGLPMDYITSRKQIYVPEYYNLVKNREMMIHWKRHVLAGNDVVIYDFDGPRTNDGSPDVLPVTLNMLINKINDPVYPFGHGYVVAAYLAGFEPGFYI